MSIDLIQINNIIHDESETEVNISYEEYSNIVEIAGVLIYELIANDPLIYSQPSFSEIIFYDTVELLSQQLQPVYDFDNFQEYIESATEEAITLYHTYVCPRRSYSNTFVRVKPNVVKMSKKIYYIENIPQPDQRTKEWYLFRHKFLTASNLWKAFGTQRAQNELIYDKCRPVDLDKYSRVNTETPMHWGQKYEDVSIEWYEKHYNTKVSEFGCIPHKDIPYLAASPDLSLIHI